MKITKIEDLDPIPTYDFTVTNKHHYLLDNGCVSHNTGIVQNSVASYLPVYNKEMYQTLSDMSVPIIPKYIKERYWSYKTKFQYHPKDIIYFTRRLQKWIDTGMSMEININPEIAKINEISDAIVEGFLDEENTLKAVYYSLTIDNNRESACSDCSN